MHELDEALRELDVAYFAILVLIEVGEYNIRVFLSDGQA